MAKISCSMRKCRWRGGEYLDQFAPCGKSRIRVEKAVCQDYSEMSVDAIDMDKLNEASSPFQIHKDIIYTNEEDEN